MELWKRSAKELAALIASMRLARVGMKHGSRLPKGGHAS